MNHPPLHVELERLLRALLSAHESLLDVTRRHHQAVRQADPTRCRHLLDEEQRVLASIAELEVSRQALVQRAMKEAAHLVGTPGGPATLARLRDLALLAPPERRPTLLDLSDRLRSLIQVVQQEQALLRVVTRVLTAHMEGLMRQVARSLSHTGTYAKGGVIPAGAPVVTSLDVRL